MSTPFDAAREAQRVTIGSCDCAGGITCPTHYSIAERLAAAYAAGQAQGRAEERARCVAVVQRMADSGNHAVEGYACCLDVIDALRTPAPEGAREVS